MEKEFLDELFKKGLSNPEVTFEEANWTAMEQRLQKRSKRVGLLWFAAIGAAAVILMAFFLVWWQPDVHPDASTVKALAVKPLQDTSTVASHNEITAGHTNRIKLKQDRRGLDQKPITSLERRAGRRAVLLSQIKATVWNMPDSNQKQLIGHDVRTKEESSWDAKKTTSIAQENRQLQVGDKPYFTLTWAPDLTSVQGAERQSFSGGVGLLYTVPLHHRISISAGALYAKKNYSSPYRFYKPNVRLAWSEKPTNVDAACDVLDIPINLNYQFYQQGRSKFTASAGISSYFMLREQYHFAYANEEAYNQSVVDYEVKGQNNHLFGVANLSITFERQINKRFSVGIQPFVKLPLTGIGYGQTKLTSKGVAVSVSFKGGK